MLESDLTTILSEVIQRLLELTSKDSELRSHVRAFAQQLLVATEPVEESTQTTSPIPTERVVKEDTLVPTDRPRSAPTASSAAIRDGLQDAVESMTSGPSSGTPAPSVEHTKHGVSDSDLKLIEERCRMKAEGARWALKRQQRRAEGADYHIDIEPLDREIIEKAKQLPECFLWMNHRDGPSPADLGLLDDLGGCFDATADAVALIRLLQSGTAAQDPHFEQALNLLAEAQSALRAAIERVGYDRNDKDQMQTYGWLRSTCLAEGIYIAKHMRASDVADPSEWLSLSNRIEALDTAVREKEKRRKQYESGLKRVRYHKELLLRGHGATHAHDWQIIIETVDNMVKAGTPPSNIDLRELLLPVVDEIPDMPLPSNFRLVMREIDCFLAMRLEPEPEERNTGQNEEVGQVATWLAGKTLVLIGGAPRPYAREALKQAFGLETVDWVETQEHDSVSRFGPHISRPEVAVVILAIRWASHQFEGAKQFCIEHRKPFVRLPAGYSPNQVAHQIVTQCSEQF